MSDVGVTDAERAAFEADRRETIAGRFRQGLPATVGVSVALIPGVYLGYKGPKLGTLLAILLCATVTMIGAALYVRSTSGRRHVIAMSVVVSWIVGVLVSFGAANTEAFHSPFYSILFLVWIFALAFLPVSPSEMAWIAVPHPLIAYATFVAMRVDPRADGVIAAVTAGGLVYSWAGVHLRHRAALQAFVTHARLGETKGALAKLNAELEARVDAQVGEIRRHAADVEALNDQLRLKVAERSRELAAALERLGGAVKRESVGPGTVLGDRVVLEKRLGEGGMGAVFEAKDRVTGRRVAVKVMSHEAMGDATQLHRFLREAEVAATIADAAVVKTLHVDVDTGGQAFLIQELVDGKTLQDHALTRLRDSPAVVARIGAGIARALAAAHAAGVVHRDVKPSNVMLCQTAPGVRVLDFGISKITTKLETGVTRLGAVMGTPAYMAPEQAREPQNVGAASDVYSLGVVLFELATGTLPFAADDALAMLMAHATDFPRDPRILAPDVPEALARAILACLEKDPAARPTAAALAAELSALADALGAPAAETLGLSRERAHIA